MTSLSIVSVFLGALLFAVSFFAAAITDMRSGLISDLCPAGLLGAGLCGILAGHIVFSDALAGFLILGVITLLLSIWRDSMGGGDVKLIAFASFAVGLRSGTLALLIAMSLALLFAIVKRILTHQRSSTALAPFLMVGYCLIYFREV